MLSPAELKTLNELLNKAETSEFNVISKMYNQALSNAQTRVANNFFINDHVQFTNKYGKVISGNITKINRKTIKVQTTDGVWVVSPSMLRKA